MPFQRIRDLREDSDKKQTELAEYLRVRQSTYSGYESGKYHIPIESLIALANFYQVNLDYLLDRTDVREPLPKPKRKVL